MIQRLRIFIERDLWRIRAHKLSRTRSILVRSIRIPVLAARQFYKDNCQLRASALTFYSLLSIVPVFAMAFGIAKGFGLEKILQTQLYEKIPAHGDVIQRIIEFSNALLENAKGGVVAGGGVLFLFWTI
ncbi:MAG: YihY/virulence factor BrkB family protein, partial [Candidatus Omnitrophica bacterium]|nr:YihY/virulence factor BrkB family protein [Candidatus Omnitrophota bacterium]